MWYPLPEEGSCPSCCSMPPAAVAHPPRCRSSTPAGRRATRGCATRPTRRRSRRSSTVMRRAGDSVHGRRLRGLIVVLWRAGLRIHEALALAEADLDPRRGSLLVRRGKGGRRREVGMDDWAWEQLAPWLAARVELPVGPLFCVVTGATRGRPWTRPPPRARAAAHRPRRRSAATLRAAPAAPRPRRRDGARGRAADRHPTPARAHQPRHHLDLPARHRQRRDHRHRPRPPRPDGPRPQLAAPLKPQDRRREAGFPLPVLVQRRSQSLDVLAGPRCSVQAEAAARPCVLPAPQCPDAWNPRVGMLVEMSCDEPLRVDHATADAVLRRALEGKPATPHPHSRVIALALDDDDPAFVEGWCLRLGQEAPDAGMQSPLLASVTSREDLER